MTRKCIKIIARVSKTVNILRDFKIVIKILVNATFLYRFIVNNMNTTKHVVQFA